MLMTNIINVPACAILEMEACNEDSLFLTHVSMKSIADGLVQTIFKVKMDLQTMRMIVKSFWLLSGKQCKVK